MPYRSHAETYVSLSQLLTDEMTASGAKSIAATVREEGEQPRLLAASAGASVSFVELCISLAESPRCAGVRELELDGIGHVMWQSSGNPACGEREVLLFALHDKGRLARGIALVDLLRRSCECALN